MILSIFIVSSGEVLASTAPAENYEGAVSRALREAKV